MAESTTVGGAGSVSATVGRGKADEAPLLSVGRIESANAVALTSADTHTAELDLHNGATLVMRDNGSNALGVRVGGREVSLDDYAKQQGMNPEQAEKLYLAAYPKLFASMFSAKSAAYQDSVAGRLEGLSQVAPRDRTPAMPMVGGGVGAAIAGAVAPLRSDVAAAIQTAQTASLYESPKVVGETVQFPGGLSASFRKGSGDVILTGGKLTSAVNLSELAKTNPMANDFLSEVGFIAGIDFIKQQQTRIEGELERLDRAGVGGLAGVAGAGGAAIGDRRSLDLRNPADAAEYDRLARSNPVFGLARAAGLEGATKGNAQPDALAPMDELARGSVRRIKAE